jgi:AcrR family transcriptional regulator
MPVPRKRAYRSTGRAQAAEITRARMLRAAKRLFARYGIDAVTIDQIARKADVSASTVYAVFKSKAGILRALMTETLFGPRFQAAQLMLVGVTDAPQLIARSAHVARAIYESESSELGLLRGTSGFSPVLRALEQEFEDIRYQMQEERVALLFAQGKVRAGLDRETARRVLWMYTGRDIYRMLVTEGGWSPDHYQAWLASTLVYALVGEGAVPYGDGASRLTER